MKMYIAIKEWVPTGHSINSAAHAGLIGYLTFQHLPETQDWLKNSFKKVTCVVSDEEFAELKRVPNCAVITESRLDNEEVALVFAPRKKEDWPEIVRNMRLWV